MLFFKKKLEKGIFFKTWGSENVHCEEKGVVFVKANLKVLSSSLFRGQIWYKITNFLNVKARSVFEVMFPHVYTLTSEWPPGNLSVT